MKSKNVAHKVHKSKKEKKDRSSPTMKSDDSKGASSHQEAEV